MKSSLKFDDKYEAQWPLAYLFTGRLGETVSPIQYGVGVLHIVKHREDLFARVRLDWQTRGGELKYHLLMTVDYTDMFKLQGFVPMFSDIFYMKLQYMVLLLEDLMSDGGLCREQWEELIELRNEQKYLEQWCVV